MDAITSRWEAGFSGLVEIQEFTWENARHAADGLEIEWNEELYSRLRILKAKLDEQNRDRFQTKTNASGKPDHVGARQPN